MSAVRITSPQCGELDAPSSGLRQSPLPAFGSSKIDRRHLERLAIVYVRQSDPQQVLLHRESKELQYNLADRAVSLGWPRERVLIIDEDQGQSAMSAASRHGIQSFPMSLWDRPLRRNFSRKSHPFPWSLPVLRTSERMILGAPPENLHHKIEIRNLPTGRFCRWWSQFGN